MILEPFLCWVWWFQQGVPKQFLQYYPMVGSWEWCRTLEKMLKLSSFNSSWFIYLHVVTAIVIFIWSGVPCIRSSWVPWCAGLQIIIYNCLSWNCWQKQNVMTFWVCYWFLKNSVSFFHIWQYFVAELHDSTVSFRSTHDYYQILLFIFSKDYFYFKIILIYINTI